MIEYSINGTKLEIGKPFSANDLNYPPDWLLFASDSALAEHNITKTHVPDPIVETPLPPQQVVASETLSELKKRLIELVDFDAEKCRLKFIKAGSGQAMTYIEKHTQAIAAHDMGETAANALTEQERKAMFPTLSASVGIEAPTLYGCAQIVIARYEAWATISYHIERAMLVGKKLISDALDAVAAQAAYEAITWPTP
jgi:hypothetical protein